MGALVFPAISASQDYLGIFGSGSDGAIVFDGVTTPVAGATLSGSTYSVVRDIQATSITINTGVTLSTANWRIFCAGTITGLGTGTISANGHAAVLGVAGAAFSGGQLQGSSAGGAGGTGVSGTGATGTNAQFLGIGGAGGAGTSGAGGPQVNSSVGASASVITSSILNNPIPILQGGAFYQGGNKGFGMGCGGSGGGSDASSNAGGGGGGGGGIVVIFAHAVNIAGTLTAIGGAGAAGTGGNAGGGGGGGGGWVIGYTLSAWSVGTIAVTGGALGAGSGTGSNGNAGGNGISLNVVLS